MAIIPADSTLKWIRYHWFLNTLTRPPPLYVTFKSYNKSLIPAIDIKTQCSSGFWIGQQHGSGLAGYRNKKYRIRKSDYL